MTVNVPVLSVQITVVRPRVSIAGISRTMAFFFAILSTPRAKTIVVTTGKPSGIADTDRAIATITNSYNTSESRTSPLNFNIDIMNVRKATPKATKTIILINCSILISRGIFALSI